MPAMLTNTFFICWEKEIQFDMNENTNSIMLSISKILENKAFIITIEERSFKDINNVTPLTSTSSFEFKTERKYNIPAYQRQIRWGKENVQTLLNDLIVGSKFLGNIMLSRKDDYTYDIIDGQQRITVLYLLLHYIKFKTNNDTLEICKYINGTYAKFDCAMKYYFDEDKMESGGKKDEILESDLLDQNDNLKVIWNTIKKSVDKLSNEAILNLKKNILASKMNVILNDNEDEESFLVNYYLDINDKSVPLDSIDILKGYMFKYNYQLMVNNWDENQKKIKSLRTHRINYNIEDIYRHYILCMANKYLDYELSGLTTEFRLPKNVNSYNKGTHIIEAIANEGFFKKMMSDIKSFCDYMLDIVDSESYNSEFKKKYTFVKSGNINTVSDISLKNYLSIQRSILLNADIVPKILLMKYYLDFLCEASSEDDYKTIYDIYVCSTIFSACEGKKSIDKFAKIVLKKDFKSAIRSQAFEMFSEKNKAKYERAVKTATGEITNTSGQYFPKDLFAIKELFKIKKGKVHVNGEQLKDYFYDNEFNVEHFFIPQSPEISFRYGEELQKRGKLEIPKNIRKKISCPGNYLLLRKSINKDIGNLWIIDKIIDIESKLAQAFSLELCKKYFNKAKEIFLDTEYIDKLKSAETEEDARDIVLEYYKQLFLDKFNCYLNSLNLIEVDNDLSR